MFNDAHARRELQRIKELRNADLIEEIKRHPAITPKGRRFLKILQKGLEVTDRDAHILLLIELQRSIGVPVCMLAGYEDPEQMRREVYAPVGRK